MIEFTNTYTPTQAQTTQIEETFKYHPPKADQIPRYEALRNAGKDLANLMVALCPPGRELAVALTNLQQTIMWANASIACGEK